MATKLRFSFHPAQLVIHDSPARFKVVAAGRRFGKTVFAVMQCILEGLRTHTRSGMPLDATSEVLYYGVDREQAKRNAWKYFKALSKPVRGPDAQSIREKDYTITLKNGVVIRLMGMDNPDAARGQKVRFVVMDEYADMPPEAWDEIIRPALADVEGGALFIGTPKGKNHFYHLFLNALTKPTEIDEETGEEFSSFEDYEAFTFEQNDNPLLPEKEKLALRREYAARGKDIHAQEMGAKFISKGGKVFHADHFKLDPVGPENYTTVIAVDLAGFTKQQGKRRSDVARRDDTAIAVVRIHDKGWWVKEIIHGQWGVRETALRIVKAAVDNECLKVGIEKGALFNACGPYLEDYQRQYNRYFTPDPLTHGNNKKWDRITWALQGRAEKGQITLNPGKWNDKFIEQAVDFPDQRTHDDLLDALAYVDQMADHVYQFDPDSLKSEFEPLDMASGY